MNGDVKIINITKKFDKVIAVDNVNLKIKEGKFVTLLGPSGCGKTTLLRIIAGFEKPTSTSGSIFIGEEEITHLPPERRPVNMVFQNYALFPHMNVFDNVAYSQIVKKKPQDEIIKKVEKILDLVSLSGFNERRINQLSGGQAQRVALARVLINEPDVLLLDEPLGALDLQVRKQMQIELKNIQKKLGTTFIYVTHDQEEAMVLSDRIVLMNNGRFIQNGKPEEIYENPKTLFAAKFVGGTNIIEGTVVELNRNGITVDTQAGIMKCAFKENINNGESIHLSIRPEKITILKEEKEAKFGNKFKGKVSERIYIGTLIRYTVVINDGLKMTVNVPVTLQSEEINVGEEVILCWPEDFLKILID